MKSDAVIGRELSAELLSLCACPKCRGSLIHNGPENTLDCVACRTQYPIRSGIPVLLQDHDGAHK